MEEKIYSLTFTGGETLEGLTLNGDNFVTRFDFDDELLSDFNLLEVTINDGENEWTEYNMKKIHKTAYGNEIYFTIAPKTEQELRDEEINSKIEYIAMMTEVEL